MLIHRIVLLRRANSGGGLEEELLDEVHIINRGNPPGSERELSDERIYEVRDIGAGRESAWVTHARGNGARELVRMALRALRPTRPRGGITAPLWMHSELLTWAQRGASPDVLQQILDTGLTAHLEGAALPRDLTFSPPQGTDSV